MIWWVIPLVATVGAWLYTRVRGAGSGSVRPRPEPGTPADVADLARFADALGRPLPGGARD